jgi:hypothetical protein
MNLDKTKIPSIALILMLILSTTMLALPIVFAHDPPWITQSWSYVGVTPETIGVGQEALIVFWPAEYPKTAQGMYGDRFTWTVEITTPDGSVETLGPFISDPVGGGWALYTPTQVGTYTIVSKFPGHTYTGLPDTTPSTIRSPESVNDTLLPSESDPTYLVVQQDQLEKYEETPLPDGYWTRPIYGANRNWWQVAGNWLGGAAQTNGPTNNYGYGEAPESAHVLWTRPFWSGGIMDTRTGSIGYYTGLSYESYGSVNFIMEGKIYYDVEQPPRMGHYCIDLYSGEVVWFKNTTGAVTDTSGTGGFDNSGEIPYGEPQFGQIYNYDSPNQHGGFPYLWVTDNGKRNTWDLHDAFTGNYICSIANVSSSGEAVYGKDGSILRYDIDDGYLTCWNTSRAIWYEPFFTSNYYWMWRPDLNTTFDGNNGFSLNVSVPDLPGGIIEVREDQFVIGGTRGKKNSTYLEEGTLWALSLAPGQEGQLLWQINFEPPETVPDNAIVRREGYRDVAMGTVDPEDGVFFFEMALTRQRWCYSLQTGQQLWTTSEPEAQFNFYGMSDFIYNGRLYSYGYSGELIAYDIQTGNVDWVWSAPPEGLGETFYPKTPLSMGCIADGKVYMYTSEHSPTMPLRRDANIWCVDLETGELIWKMSCWASGPKIADGRLVTYNLFDNSIYCYGKGPSATTVSLKDDVSSLGSSVMITGTVTDQTSSGRFTTNGILDFSLQGTPAIADEDQEAWMEYLYQQRPMPTDAKGVTVKLYSIDPNGNYQDLGTTTTDIHGNFGKSWVPPVPGEYYVVAEFEGSASYGSSSASTYFVVDEAPSAAQPIEPEPVAPASAQPEPAALEPAGLEPATLETTEINPVGATEATLITNEVAIITVVAVACVLGIAAFLALRKRK